MKNKMSDWIIEDWMSKHVYRDQRFDSFEAARDFISQVADDEAWRQFPDDEARREELYNGICEDLYAIEVAA